MPATPIHALPYPVASDPADVPADIQELATALDAKALTRPALVAALPGTPADGQEIYFQSTAMATAGIVWHLRYRAAAAGSYKWEFVGGNSLMAAYRPQSTGLGISTYTWFSFAEGISIAPPLNGEYEADSSAMLYANAAAQVAMGLRIHTSDPATDFEVMTVESGGWKFMREYHRLTLLAGQGVEQRYQLQAGASATMARKPGALTLRPIRVG